MGGLAFVVTSAQLTYPWAVYVREVAECTRRFRPIVSESAVGGAPVSCSLSLAGPIVRRLTLRTVLRHAGNCQEW